MADRKTRNWWFILYPESAPEDWMQILSDKMVPCAISPLHDADALSDGTLKKPHYHVMLHYEGPTTYNHVLELTRSLNQPIPQVYDSPAAAYAYLTHSNNADKAQYSDTDIVLLNGFQPSNLRSRQDKRSDLRKEIVQFIYDNQLTDFSTLVSVAMVQSDQGWLDAVISDSFFYTRLLNSIHFDNSV